MNYAEILNVIKFVYAHRQEIMSAGVAVDEFIVWLRDHIGKHTGLTDVERLLLHKSIDDLIVQSSTIPEVPPQPPPPPVVLPPSPTAVYNEPFVGPLPNDDALKFAGYKVGDRRYEAIGGGRYLLMGIEGEPGLGGYSSPTWPGFQAAGTIA